MTQDMEINNKHKVGHNSTLHKNNVYGLTANGNERFLPSRVDLWMLVIQCRDREMFEAFLLQF